MFDLPILNRDQKTMKNQDELIAQAAAIITMGEKVLASETAEGQSKTFVNEQKFHDFRITALSFLSRVFGEVSSYYQSFKTEVTHNTASRTRRGVGMLTAAKRELKGDWLETTRGAVARDFLLIFSASPGFSSTKVIQHLRQLSVVLSLRNISAICVRQEK